MSSGLSLLSTSGRSKSEAFNLKDIEVLVDSKEQHWFKRAHIGQYLAIARIITSTTKLAEKDMKSRAFLQVEGRGRGVRTTGSPREDTQVPNMFVSITGALYLITNSRKDKGKVLKENILRDIILRGLMQGLPKYKKSITQLQQIIHERDNRIQAIQYKNVGLQGEIRAKDLQIANLE